MPWLKSGDNAATHPIVMRVPAQRMNEVFGFVVRCALQSAAHLTDYFVDEGTASMIGMGSTEELLKLAVKAGYFTPNRKDGHRGWQIVEDPEFLHIRLRAEVEWERQQKADAANLALIVPVRLRDGDACRYCGYTVQWAARRGPRRATYDHRQPGVAATVDTYVVACGACNSGRRADADADARYPLREAPASPYYSRSTAAWLAKHGHAVTPTETPRPGEEPDPANTAIPQPAGQRDSDPAAGGTPQPPRPRTQRDPATTIAGPAVTADRQPTESGLVGSGRDGPVTRSSPTTSPRRRGRRGRPRQGTT